MPDLPPTALVLETLRFDVLPAAGGAAVVACLLLLLGRWAGALASAAALVVAFGWANYRFDKLKWEKTERLIPWKLDDPFPAWHLLPRAALVLVLVGLLSRWAGLIAGRLLTKPVPYDQTGTRYGRYWWGANVLVWAPRAAVVAAVSGWLVSPQAEAHGWWVWPALAGVMLLNWVALDGVARGGAGAQAAAYQFAAFLAAGVLMLYASSGVFSEVALVIGFGMLGVAAACGSARADASGAVPAGVAFLPGLMLHGRLLTESAIPLESFWLIALAPLTLLPFLIPAVGRWPRGVVIPLRAVLVLTPLVVAVALANEHQPLEYPAF